MRSPTAVETAVVGLLMFFGSITVSLLIAAYNARHEFVGVVSGIVTMLLDWPSGTLVVIGVTGLLLAFIGAFVGIVTTDIDDRP